MASNGGAFLALWNDIAPHREAEYEQWHTREHVPERVAVTGFHGARRYVNRADTAHRYFTLYEVTSAGAFEHAEYLDLVDHPTPWSASMRPDFRNIVRATCEVTASQGHGIGAAIAVLCHARSAAATTVDAIGSLMEMPGVVACHVGEGTAGAPADWSRSTEPPAPLRAFDRILLVEALDRDRAGAALADAKRQLRLEAVQRDFGCDVYDLAFVFPGHDASERVAHRRSTWPSA